MATDESEQKLHTPVPPRVESRVSTHGGRKSEARVSFEEKKSVGVGGSPLGGVGSFGQKKVSPMKKVVPPH